MKCDALLHRFLWCSIVTLRLQIKHTLTAAVCVMFASASHRIRCDAMIYMMYKISNLDSARHKIHCIWLAPFDRSHTSSYLPSIVTMTLSCIVCEIKTGDCQRVSGPLLLQGSNVPSTLGRYASDCVDRRPVINKRRSTAHRWRCHWSHMLLQNNTQKYNTFLLIMDFHF